MTSRRWAWLAVTALVVTLSYWAGRRHAPAGAAAPAPAAPAARPIVVERAAMAGGGFDRDELRAVVREELARSAAERAEAGAEAPAAVEPPDPARAARVAAAVTSANAAIEEGIADGLWDANDREALREQLPYLGERETHAVLSPLFQAINAQRVKLDGPPI